MNDRVGGLYGNAREAVNWALNHWTKNYKDELKGVTAYHIAQMTGYSPQWINKILAQMYWNGKVAYRADQYRKNFVRRVYVWESDARNDKTKGWAMPPMDRLL